MHDWGPGNGSQIDLRMKIDFISITYEYLGEDNNDGDGDSYH